VARWRSGLVLLNYCPPTQRSWVRDSAGEIFHLLFRTLFIGNDAHSLPLQATDINVIKGSGSDQL